MPDLFDPPPMPEPPRVRTSDPATSHAAARALEPKLGHLQMRILGTLNSAYSRGCTTGEIARSIGEPRDSISPRMVPMEDLGLVARTGDTRKLEGGRQQEVWRITERGVSWYMYA